VIGGQRAGPERAGCRRRQWWRLRIGDSGEERCGGQWRGRALSERVTGRGIGRPEYIEQIKGTRNDIELQLHIAQHHDNG
jgi:hypothetical protein